MGTFSKIVNGLILLCSIIVFTGAYLLNSKSSAYIGARNTLSKGLADTAKTLDKTDQTGLAKEMSNFDTEKVVNQDKVKELEQLVSKVTKLAGDVAKQRDILAERMGDIAVKLNASDIDTAKLKTLEGYLGESGKLKEAVRKQKLRSQEIEKAYKSIVSLLGKSGSTSLDNERDVKNSLKLVKNEIKELILKQTKLESSIKTITSALGIKATNISDRTIQKAIDEVANMKAELEEASTLAKRLKKMITTTRKKAKSSQKKAKKLQKLLDSKIAYVKQLTEELQLAAEMQDTTSTEPTQIEFATPVRRLVMDQNVVVSAKLKALRTVRGTVVQINKKWGLAVIYLGSKATDIPTRSVMEVVRTQEGEDQFVSQLKISRVYEQYAVGHIISKAYGAQVYPGDTVYFSDETIDEMQNEI